MTTSQDPETKDRSEEPAEEVTPIAPLEGRRLRSCIEALLFASPEPIPRKRLRSLLREASAAEIDDALLQLEADLVSHGHGFTLVEDAAGVQLLSHPDFFPYLQRLRGERRIRLSQAAFETLAVIAYRQPIRRADLETIRGVQCGPVLKNLAEWGLVKITGRDESIGRPLLYGTTESFLVQFGLSGLIDLPAPERLRELGDQHGVEVEETGPVTADRPADERPEEPETSGP